MNDYIKTLASLRFCLEPSVLFKYRRHSHGHHPIIRFGSDQVIICWQEFMSSYINRTVEENYNVSHKWLSIGCSFPGMAFRGRLPPVSPHLVWGRLGCPARGPLCPGGIGWYMGHEIQCPKMPNHAKLVCKSNTKIFGLQNSQQYSITHAGCIYRAWYCVVRKYA